MDLVDNTLGQIALGKIPFKSNSIDPCQRQYPDQSKKRFFNCYQGYVELATTMKNVIYVSELINESHNDFNLRIKKRT